MATLHRGGTQRRSAISQSAAVHRVHQRAGRFTANGWRNKSGWYDNDPFGDLGRLRDELFRAVRLVVDTGIHAKHWTREQAIAYMREKTGMGEKEVKSEIERYIVAPGQACAYKIGMLKIQELRARAQKELGEKFDQREFHDAVLKNGALPLEILEEQVNDYIQRKKAIDCSHGPVGRLMCLDICPKRRTGAVATMRSQMRKILITLAILIAFVIAFLATWIFCGRQISLFLDRFGTIEMTSARIHSTRV